MKKIAILIVILTGISVLALLMALSSYSKEKVESGQDHGFAVVELYTSEGCSSCPPADKLLSTIISDARENGKPVYALAFHVDYWNYLGWKDIYSSSSYSQRQRKYAKLLDSHVYTPQMVVNGKHEFVGSNKYKANRYIGQAISKKSAEALSVDIQQDAQNITVRYKLAKKLKGAQLNIALVERGLSQSIKRGENKGRRLHHDNVVRFFSTRDLTSREGKEVLSAPKDLDMQKASVIAYVQDQKTGQVSAAQKQDLAIN